MGELRIGDKRYPIVADSLLPEGKRAINREWRATNANDASRIKRVQYQVSGPIGNSLESVSGKLGVDFTQNLETRHAERLMSLGKRTAVSLSAQNPPVIAASTPSVYGTAYYGTSYYGGTQVTSGSATSSGDIVRHFAEQQGFLFAMHGAISTQIGPLSSGWTVVGSETLPAIIVDAVHWRQFIYLALDTSVQISAVINATSAGATYAHNLGVYATALALGSDRIWYANENNALSYTLDQFATLAAPFPVGDPLQRVNGIGPYGPYTHIGKIGGLFSFTDQGKPAPLSRALAGHLSTDNGDQWADPGWGWNYAITNIGLRAITGSVDNPVGVGERMKQFTGHGGRPTAIWADRGELFVAYVTVAGNAYLYRCVFSDETASTGQPDMYPMRYLTSTEIGAIFSSNSPTNPVIVWGEDGDIAYETISRDGRDDTFAARLYSTSGGTWYGTTCDRDPHLLKTLRLARMRVLNVEFCSTWQLAMSFDLNPWIALDHADTTWINVGAELDKPGEYTLRPNAGPNGEPLEGISGRNFKPRLIQTAEGTNAETLPPEVNGVLEIEYDERPAMIEEVSILIQAGTNADARIAEIVAFASEQTDGPLPVVIEGKKAYAMVAGQPARKDLAGNGVEGLEVILQVWDVS